MVPNFWGGCFSSGAASFFLGMGAELLGRVLFFWGSFLFPGDGRRTSGAGVFLLGNEIY
jgi:hypothetical protein